MITLHLDAVGWRRHQQAIAASTKGLVPVAKGNGYGFGIGRLAAEASELGVDTLAVGTALEVAAARGHFDGDIVVLTPWQPWDQTASALLADPRVISTVGRLDGLARLQREHAGARILVERLTSMCRHGLEDADLARAAGLCDGLRVEGWTIHLPMVGAGRQAEARALAASCLNVVRAPLWFSHLDAAEVASIGREHDVGTRLRLGTQLWLGAPHTRRVTARVLDLHPVRRGQRIGYWQRRIPADGWVVVVSGGTANGIALSAPTSGATWRQRAITAANGSLDALGLALSPYTLAGKKRFFVEPPHMQSSLVFLPGSASVTIGDEVPVEVRLTTATVDQIIE